MVRLKFDEEEPRVLRRRSWLGVGGGSSVESRAVEGGDIGFVDMLLLGERNESSCDFPVACSEGNAKSLLKGPVRTLILDFGSSDCIDGKGATEVSAMTRCVLLGSRFRFDAKSELCLPLTGVTGSLWETLSESSSSSSGIGSESSVGN